MFNAGTIWARTTSKASTISMGGWTTVAAATGRPKRQTFRYRPMLLRRSKAISTRFPLLEYILPRGAPQFDPRMRAFPVRPEHEQFHGAGENMGKRPAFGRSQKRVGSRFGSVRRSPAKKSAPSRSSLGAWPGAGYAASESIATSKTAPKSRTKFLIPIWEQGIMCHEDHCAQDPQDILGKTR